MGVSRFNVMLEPDLWAWAGEFGKQDQRSASFIVNKAIAEYKAKHCKKPKETKKQVAEVEEAIGYLDCTNGQFPVTQKLVDQWAIAYPAVDIGAELNKIAAWLISNPVKRKTVRGCSAFVNRWLSKTQDKGGNNGLQNQNASNHPKGSNSNPMAGVNAALEAREQRINQGYGQTNMALESGRGALPYQVD